MRLLFVLFLLGFVALAHATCTAGYEPNSPFPGCVVRQVDVYNRVFAALLGRKVYSNFSGLCIPVDQAQVLWTPQATIGSTGRLQQPLAGCFTEGLLCYDAVTSTYACGCLEDCSATMAAYHDIGSYIFNNNIVVY